MTCPVCNGTRVVLTHPPNSTVQHQSYCPRCVENIPAIEIQKVNP